MSILQLEGAHENVLSASGEFNPLAPRTALFLPSGERLVLPTEILLQALAGRGSTELNVSEEAVRRPSLRASAPVDNTIALVEEQLTVAKVAVETDRLRLHKEVQEHVERVEVPLTETRWEVERVPVGREVEVAPEVRDTGDVMVFPVTEERLVVKRVLWFKEEVHVKKTLLTRHLVEEYVLRKDVLTETRTAPD